MGKRLPRKKGIILFKSLAKRFSREEKGFTLIELLIVVVILGILATIVVMNVTGAVGTAKDKSFATALSTMQASSDEFYAKAAIYPTFTQPGGANPNDAAIVNTTSDGLTPPSSFLPGYIRTAPDQTASDYGVTGQSGTLSWGVTETGTVFATTNSLPIQNGNASYYCVFTQNSVNNASGSLSDLNIATCPNGSVHLSTIE